MGIDADNRTLAGDAELSAAFDGSKFQSLNVIKEVGESDGRFPLGLSMDGCVRQRLRGQSISACL